MLGPLRTMLKHLADHHFLLTRVILIRGMHDQDQDYCVLVMKELVGKSNTSVEIGASVAGYVSKAADSAALSAAKLWVDLTPGPKQRTAVIFAAASAVPYVEIVYSEAVEAGKFEVRTVPPLDSYNRWLGRHGILIRNYCDELRSLAEEAERAGRGFQRQSLLAAISDILSLPASTMTQAISPRANLMTLAEWVANKAVLQKLPGISFSGNSWQSHRRGETCDKDIRALGDEWLRSAGRASQMVYQLRNLYAHPARGNYTAGIHDAVALLDGLVFLQQFQIACSDQSL
jgi:hypothetical protein